MFTNELYLIRIVYEGKEAPIGIMRLGNLCGLLPFLVFDELKVKLIKTDEEYRVYAAMIEEVNMDYTMGIGHD